MSVTTLSVVPFADFVIRQFTLKNVSPYWVWLLLIILRALVVSYSNNIPGVSVLYRTRNQTLNLWRWPSSISLPGPITVFQSLPRLWFHSSVKLREDTTRTRVFPSLYIVVQVLEGQGRLSPLIPCWRGSTRKHPLTSMSLSSKWEPGEYSWSRLWWALLVCGTLITTGILVV